MTQAKPLVEFWTQERDINEKLAEAADKRAAALTNAKRGIWSVPEALEARASDTADAQEAQKLIAKLRGTLPTALPPQLTADAVQLKTAIASQREATGKALLHGDLASVLQAEAAFQQAEKTTYLTLKAEAESALKAAEAREKIFSEWSEPVEGTLKGEFLAISKAAHSAVSTGPEKLAADKAFEELFPAPLLDQFQTRALVPINSLFEALSKLRSDTRTALTEQHAFRGRDARVEIARAEYEQSWSALQAFILTGRAQITQAIAVYAAVPAATLPLKSAIARLEEHPKSEEPKEADRVNALTTLLSAFHDYEVARQKAGPDHALIDMSVDAKAADAPEKNTPAAPGAPVPKDAAKVPAEEEESDENAAPRTAKRDKASAAKVEPGVTKSEAPAAKGGTDKTAAEKDAPDKIAATVKDASDKEVAAALTTLKSAWGAFQKSEAAHAAERKSIREWLSGIPDAAFQAYLNAQQADKILNDLGALEASSLVTAWRAAENKLVTTLRELNQARRTELFLAHLVTEIEAIQTGFQGARLEHFMSAVRSDV